MVEGFLTHITVNYISAIPPCIPSIFTITRIKLILQKHVHKNVDLGWLSQMTYTLTNKFLKEQNGKPS